MNNPLILAYYLPQFHTFPENDLWWGKGFTEWTNVKKAKPLFWGHKQPRIPTELGYYDLTNPEIRIRQAELAKEAGIGGFCYWHYWFNGKQLMNKIVDEVAETGSPDFPFCLAWANESWSKKMWNKDCSGDKLLIEQTYNGVEDCRNHYLYARNLFKNKNYVRIDGRPFFLIYKPQYHPQIEQHINLWNKWIREDGIADSIYFVANLDQEADKEKIISYGFSAVNPSSNARALYAHYHLRRAHAFFADLKRDYLGIPFKIRMENVNKSIVKPEFDSAEDVIPVLFPQWDHSPRSGKKAFVVTHSTPELFGLQAKSIINLVKNKRNKIIMLKSWNEWAEGNYMEPDELNGRGFINALKKEIDR